VPGPAPGSDESRNASSDAQTGAPDGLSRQMITVVPFDAAPAEERRPDTDHQRGRARAVEHEGVPQDPPDEMPGEGRPTATTFRTSEFLICAGFEILPRSCVPHRTRRLWRVTAGLDARRRLKATRA
jgi:hypothetical protein